MRATPGSRATGGAAGAGAGKPVRRAVRPTPVEPILRRPIGRDTAPLVELYVRARRSYYEGHLPEAELAEWAEGLRAKGLDYDRRDRLWTCAEVAGVPAGFALVSFDGELLQLQVDPPHWGTGVGRALHDAALDDLRGADNTTAWLHVFAPNTRARAFYTRLGWRDVGPAEHDHRRMELDLG